MWFCVAMRIVGSTSGNSITKNNCPSSSSCRPLVQCAAYLSSNELTSQSRICTQDSGEDGVCCPRFTRNKSEFAHPVKYIAEQVFKVYIFNVTILVSTYKLQTKVSLAGKVCAILVCIV